MLFLLNVMQRFFCYIYGFFLFFPFLVPAFLSKFNFYSPIQDPFVIVFRTFVLLLLLCFVLLYVVIFLLCFFPLLLILSFFKIAIV